MIKPIKWNGYLSRAIKSYKEEVAGFIFSDKPYSKDEKWIVYPCSNKSENPSIEWVTDGKEIQKIKTKAKTLKLTRIGNIHTHPLQENEALTVELITHILTPSDKDLAYAQKFNDIIRGIMVCTKKEVIGLHFHDKFGRTVLMQIKGDCLK